MCAAHRKIVVGKKLVNFENPTLFAKIFLAIYILFRDTPKMYLAYALTVTYLPIFPCQYLLPVWFAKNFPCTVLVLVLKYF